MISSWRIMILGAFRLPNLRLFCNEICMSTCDSSQRYTLCYVHSVWVHLDLAEATVHDICHDYSGLVFLDYFFYVVYNKPRVIYGTLWADTGAVHIRNMLLALLTLVSNKTGILWPGCSHFSPAYYISSFLRELAGMCWSSPTEPCSHSESPIKTFVIEVGRSRYEL